MDEKTRTKEVRQKQLFNLTPNGVARIFACPRCPAEVPCFIKHVRQGGLKTVAKYHSQSLVFTWAKRRHLPTGVNPLIPSSTELTLTWHTACVTLTRNATAIRRTTCASVYDLTYLSLSLSKRALPVHSDGRCCCLFYSSTIQDAGDVAPYRQ